MNTQSIRNAALISLSLLGGAFALCMPSTASAQGTMNGWGLNTTGELGNGNSGGINHAPVKVAGLTHIVSAVGGYSHSAALRNDGTVWTWGANTYGELGNGATTESDVPIQVSAMNGVVGVAAGSAHTLAVKSDGTVWAWGLNNIGQLGNGTYTDSHVPVRVAGLTGVVAVAASLYHSMALCKDGTVWTWGSNSSGELGNGTNMWTNLPVQALRLYGVVGIAAGENHSLAIKGDGSAWGWGNNYYGQLGDGTNTNTNVPIPVGGLSGVVGISGGDVLSLFLTSDGAVWACGDNTFGELGNGTTISSRVPMQVSGLSDVVGIAAGAVHGLAVKGDGTVWAWGYNGFGELGDNSGANSDIPVQVTGLSGAAGVAGGRYHSLSFERMTGTQTVTIAVAAAAGQIGKNVTLSATVTDDATGAKLTGKAVQFAIDGANIGTPATTDSTGVARYTVAVLEGAAVGTHTTSATFAGDADYAPGAGAGTLKISKGTVKLTVPGVTGILGNTVTLSAKLINGSGAAVVGVTISFTVNGGAVGFATTDSSGQAKIAYSIPDGMATGTHIITAAFAGNASYLAATHNAMLTVNKKPVKLTVPAVTGAAGTSVVLSAKLTDAANAAIAGAPLSFSVDGSAIGSASTNSTGVASLHYTIPSGRAGSYTITVSFAGDAAHQSSTKTGTLKVN